MIVKYRIFSEVKMWYPETTPPVNGVLPNLSLTQNGWVCEMQRPHAEVEYYKEPEAVVMLWTGRKDCNGKDIYDGDIAILGLENTARCLVVWNSMSCGFALQMFDGCMALLFPITSDMNLRVVGNIHENPELLEVCDG